MRALAAAKLPVEIAVVFFRDPTARVAVIMKLSFRMIGRAGVELAAAADALTEADFVPRKNLAEIIVTGDAYSAETAAVIPVQIAMGGKLQVRAEVRTPNGVPATRAPLVGFGAIAPRFSLAAPKSGKEASFSDAWVEAHRDGFQVAPPDQRTPEPLGPATPLSFFNLSQGGGIMGLTLPRVAPFALLVEGEGKGNAHRVAMRCDTVHVDTTSAALHLSFRGEVELDRFATLPDLVVGLLSGQQVPRAADIQVAFGAGVELPLRHLNHERVTEAAEARSKLNETQRVTARSKSSTLPFVGQTSKSMAPSTTLPLRTPPPPDEAADSPGPGGTLSVRAGVVFPILGNWRLGALIRDLGDRIVYEAKHVTTAVRGRLTCLSSRDPDAKEQFRADVARRRRVEHVGLNPVLELGADEGRPFVVEGLLGGELLSQSLARGPFGAQQATAIVRAVAQPLSAIHAAELVYASLSLESIAIEGDKVTLEAPASLRKPNDARAPRSKAFGPLASPEVAAGRWADVTARSDVWSLAALLVTLVSGKPIKRGEVPALDALPAALARTVTRALSEDPGARHADAGALMAALPSAPETPFATPSTIDDEPTVDPRGTVPLIDRAMLSALPRPTATSGDDDDHPTLPPAASDEREVTMTPDSVDDEHPTIPPPPGGRPRLPPIHVDSETTSLLELPMRPKIDEERTGLIQLPLRATPQEQALPFVPTAVPATGRPPPPNDDAMPFGRIDALEAGTGMGRQTLLEGSMPKAALPFAVAPPRTPPTPRPSGRGGTPWEKPASTAPPPDMGPEQNGGTLPPPPPDEPALARSFGLGASTIASPALPSFASSVWRDAPTRATTLDAATIARVVTSPDANLAIIGLERSRIDFALGLEEWANLLDSNADKRDFVRLSELLSALHVEALTIR